MEDWKDLNLDSDSERIETPEPPGSGVYDVPKIPDAPMKPVGNGVYDVPKIPDASMKPVGNGVYDVPKIPEAPMKPAGNGVLDVPKIPDAPMKPEGNGALDVPQSPEAAVEPAEDSTLDVPPERPERPEIPWEGLFDVPRADAYRREPSQSPYAATGKATEARGVVDEILYEAGASAYRPQAAQIPQTAQIPPQPAENRQQKPKKKQLMGWIWLLIGLLAGFGLGFLTARLTQGKPEEPARPGMSAQSIPSEGSVSGQLRIADDAAISTMPAVVYEENVSSVVGIVAEGSSQNYWGQSSSVASVGTGFIISEEGYLLTNYHVVQGSSKVTVMLYDGRELPAELVGYDGGICDLALLKIEADDLKPVTFGSSDSLIVGQQVCAIGNPLGELTYSLTVGYISAKDRLISTDGSPINMLQTDCTINSGNSGGPLFDMNGNVIGITTAKYSGTTSTGTTVEGIGFAIPIDDVVVLLDDLQTYGRVTTQPYLGVSVQISAPVGDYPPGAYIKEVVKGGAADQAGILADDMITGIGDYEVDSYNGLVSAMRHYHAGDTVEIRIWRAGESLSLTLTFAARPSEEPTQTTEPAETQSPFGWSFP